MVLITPRLVRPMDPDEVPSLPTRPGAFLSPSDEEDQVELPAPKPPEPDVIDAPPMAPETGKKPPTPPPGAASKPPKL